MRYVINDRSFDAVPKNWPTNSTFDLMHEGDPYSDVFRLNNSGMTKESIQLIISVVTKDIKMDRLLGDDINWNDLLYTTNYLGLGVSVDFIYPLLLTIEDREEWYRTCETRLTHICSESTEEPSKLTPSAYVFGGTGGEANYYTSDDEKIAYYREKPYYPHGSTEDEKKSIYEEGLLEVSINRMRPRESDYDLLGRDAFKYESGLLFQFESELTILEALSHVPRLFVAGGYPLAKFTHGGRKWSDIDIFAYGDNALEHIKEGVRICIEMFDMRKIEANSGENLFPVRTQYSISIPILTKIEHRLPHDVYEPLVVQFILIKSRSKYHILNRFDLDSTCIGFDIGNHSRYYALTRFIRAFETKTNVTDPTRQSPTYIRRLIKYAKRGYNIAVPGFNSDNIRLSSKIMKLLIEDNEKIRNRSIKSMKLIGLEGLVTSALTRRNMAIKERTTISGQHSDYAYVDTSNVESIIISMLPKDFPDVIMINGGNPIRFVPGDVLNEDDKPVHLEVNFMGTKYVTFVPKYPIIKLMNDDPQNGMIGSIHQVTSSFYGEYYGAIMQAKPKMVSRPRRSFRAMSPIRTTSHVVVEEEEKKFIRSRIRVTSPIKPRSRIRATSPVFIEEEEKKFMTSSPTTITSTSPATTRFITTTLNIKPSTSRFRTKLRVISKPRSSPSKSIVRTPPSRSPSKSIVRTPPSKSIVRTPTSRSMASISPGKSIVRTPPSRSPSRKKSSLSRLIVRTPPSKSIVRTPSSRSVVSISPSRKRSSLSRSMVSISPRRRKISLSRSIVTDNRASIVRTTPSDVSSKSMIERRQSAITTSRVISLKSRKRRSKSKLRVISK